jgi:hypothetical protein
MKSLKGRDHTEDQGIDGKIILNGSYIHWVLGVD